MRVLAVLAALALAPAAVGAATLYKQSFGGEADTYDPLYIQQFEGGAAIQNGRVVLPGNGYSDWHKLANVDGPLPSDGARMRISWVWPGTPRVTNGYRVWLEVLHQPAYDTEIFARILSVGFGASLQWIFDYLIFAGPAAAVLGNLPAPPEGTNTRVALTIADATLTVQLIDDDTGSILATQTHAFVPVPSSLNSFVWADFSNVAGGAPAYLDDLLVEADPPRPDSDGDGRPDYADACPADPGKIDPGICGCGTADVDADFDGSHTCEGDCDDSNTTVFPGAPELCEGIDNNCDGTIDEGCYGPPSDPGQPEDPGPPAVPGPPGGEPPRSPPGGEPPAGPPGGSPPGRR